MSGTVLEVTGLGKTYGSGPTSKVAIGDVSFAVRPQEFLSIVGPSGAGKTTLLKCLTGLLEPSAGNATFDGAPIKEPPARMALVFQDYGRSLFPWLTVGGNVGLPLRGKGLERSERRQRIESALEAVGLPDVARRYPWQLSGGMQQRVALARALAYQPECLVMDEPFASVDAQTRFDLEDLILRVQAEFGITVLFVTHDIDEAVYLSDRVVVLTSSPARVRAVLDVELDAPRDQVQTKRDPRFAELRTTLFELVRRPGEDGGLSVLVAEAIGEAAGQLGTGTAFGLAGSGNLLAINAMRDAGMEYVAATHEAGAVAMADGFARVSGAVGVATVHQGPGLTNALTPLTEAVRSHTPLLLLAADGARRNQALDQAAVVESVGATVARLHAHDDPGEVVARAHATARDERTPVVLMLPLDVQQQAFAGEVVVPELAPPAPRVPSEDQLARANAAIAMARRPLVLAGRGAVDAGPELRELAARIGAVVATTIVAKGLFAGDAFDVGALGGFASPLATELALAADLVVAAGTSLDPWTTCDGRLPSPGTPVVRIDDRAGPGVTVLADARLAAERLDGRPGDSWRTPELADRIAAERRADAIPPCAGLDPRGLAAAIDAALPADRIVAVDSGHFLAFAGMYVGATDPRAYLFAQGFQSVGLGLATAIGGAVAGRGRVTAALIGDGGAQMSLLELATAVRLALPLVVVVFDDGGYGAEFHDFEPHGIPADVARFPPRDFAALARALGARAATVRSLDDLAGLELTALDGPLLLDAKVDPEVDAVSVMSEVGAADWSMPAPGSLV